MKVCMLLALGLSAMALWPQSTGESVHARTRTAQPERGRIFELHLIPGYVSSVRVPDVVTAVVVGDPSLFKAEHSESEPQMIFIKPISNEPAQSNALILTKSGEEFSLRLSNAGKSAAGGDVDFFLDYSAAPVSMIIPAQPSFQPMPSREKDSIAAALVRQSNARAPKSDAKHISGFVGSTIQEGKKMFVPFSVLNGSDSLVELLPPQVQLSGSSAPGRQKKRHQLKVEPLVVTEYRLNARRLAPGERTDGIVVFDRPAFKQGGEQLELRLAEAQHVDRPLVLPFPFSAAEEGDLP